MCAWPSLPDSARLVGSISGVLLTRETGLPKLAHHLQTVSVSAGVLEHTYEQHIRAAPDAGSAWCSCYDLALIREAYHSHDSGRNLDDTQDGSLC